MYEVKVLGSDEFDQIAKSDPRYRFVDDTNLGFADREKGIAYVRHTSIHDLNKYLINHELEELMEAQSEHEDANGIRHKKGPKFFKDILAPIFSLGGVAPESEQREAAQTQFVDGVGNVPKSQAQFYQGPSGSPRQFSSPLSGFNTGGQSGTSRVPDSVSGSLPGGFGGELSPELRQRLSGFYSGRIVF